MSYANGISTPGLVALPPWRSRLLFIALMLALCGLLVRAVYLQGFQNDFLQQKGNARYSRVVKINAHRGMITDRNGKPLAISTPMESVWVNPQVTVDATAKQIEELAQALGMSNEEVNTRMSDTARDFVYLKRQLPPEQVANILKLEIPGVSSRREYRRYYPSADMTAHLLGFTNLDDKGQEGLELQLQSQLSGQVGSERVIKDLRGHIVEDVVSILAPKPGKDIALSIDSLLQYQAFREIKLAVKQHHAKSGSIVVLNAKSGEVLALANWPSYNPNNRAGVDFKTMRNHAITDIYEPGSTMKPFTIAIALEVGKVTPRTIIKTENGAYNIGKRTIHDSHSEYSLSVSQVIQKSSNIGAAKIALSLPPEIFWRGLHEVGFGELTGSRFPGETSGKLRDYKTWQRIEQATMAYGNGISVNLLQLARAYTVFANDGELKQVTLLKQDAPTVGKKVFSKATVKEVIDMMELVVHRGGTAPLAQIKGYRVAGKTGTAHKLKGHHYVNHYIASFVGMAPASDPRLIVAVMVDDPSGGSYYGGHVAAPAFSHVMAAALRQLNIPNDAPLGNVLTPSVKFIKEAA